MTWYTWSNLDIGTYHVLWPVLWSVPGLGPLVWSVIRLDVGWPGLTLIWPISACLYLYHTNNIDMVLVDQSSSLGSVLGFHWFWIRSWLGWLWVDFDLTNYHSFIVMLIIKLRDGVGTQSFSSRSVLGFHWIWIRSRSLDPFNNLLRSQLVMIPPSTAYVTITVLHGRWCMWGCHVTWTIWGFFFFW